MIVRTYSLPSAIRLGAMGVIASGVVFSAARAQASDVPSGGGGSAFASQGAVELKYAHDKGLPTSVQTGFQGPSFAQMNVALKLDPVKDGGPLFSVVMSKGALIEASWGATKQIVLKARNGAPKDGLVTVRHTLSPSIDFKFNAGGVQTTASYSALDLVNKIPGAKFFYDSKASQPFAPWAFTAIDTRVDPASDVANTTLFSTNMNVLPKLVSDNVTGSFGVRATTSPTFSYKTTKIFLAGVDGALTSEASEITLPAVDGDSMELMTAVEGEMSVKGAIYIQPFFHIDTIGSDNDIDADFGTDIFSFDYTVPAQKVNFPTTAVHIPLPNVHVPSRGVDFGKVRSGGRATKKVMIDNSGEKEAVMSFRSSDPQFSVTGDTVTVPPKGAYNLTVTFSPESASSASADIVVSSNDADSPEQKVRVGANGANVGAEEDDLGLPNGDAEDGCGCKAAGASPVPGWAGLGLAGIGAVVAFRRRRRVT